MVRRLLSIASVLTLLSCTSGQVPTDDTPLEDVGTETDAPDEVGGETSEVLDTDVVEDSDGSGLTDPLALPPELIPGEGEFLVAILPDTQIYAWRYPETFQSQTRWIAERAAAYNIVFVSHVGDIVQTASVDAQWDAALAAYAWLDDIDMPHGFSIGGHDTMPGNANRIIDNSCSSFSHMDCESIDFRNAFGPDRYAQDPWYGGASPTGRSSYQVVEAEGLPLLFLHLPQDTPREEVEWAGEILDANPGALVHLTTHRYLFDYRLTNVLPPPLSAVQAGRFNFLAYRLGDQRLLYNSGLTSDALFYEFIDTHPNIWAVHCGHVDAEFNQAARNSAGLPVYEILANFQDMEDGGGGWLRLLLFRPQQNEVEVFTFSTVTGRVRENGEGFEHAIGILETYKNAYADDLVAFGLDPERLDALLEDVKTPGPLQDQYYESLYGAGRRDSRFTLSVDFDAYRNATR